MCGGFLGAKLFQGVLFTICLSLIGSFCFAETKQKPVSLSYVDILKCFPVLKNEAQTLKVDLNVLKDDIDRNYITTQSLLRYRQVVLKDSGGQKKRLKISARSEKKGTFSYLLSLEKLDEKGAGTPMQVPAAQRVNPSQKVLDQYFLNQEILEDERSYFDTKLNGLSMSFKRQFQKVYELELVSEKSRRRLLCEEKVDLGVVCTCFQK